jgi:CRP/FNR family nitrogen fixation transcriptional regulator
VAPIQTIIQELRPLATPARAGQAKDSAALDRLRAAPVLVSLDAQQELFAQDDPVRHCYQVVSGCLRTVRLMEDGRRLVGGFLMAGSLLGFEARALHDFAAQAVCPTILRSFSHADVANMAARDPGFGQFLWHHASDALRREHEHMLLLGRKTAAERVASFLRDMAARAGRDKAGLVPLPMCRADIADHLGLTVETVSRTMTQLRRMRVIDILPGRITILDPRALTDSACETAMPAAA